MDTTQSFIVPSYLYNNIDDVQMTVEFNDRAMILQPFGLELFTHADAAHSDLFRKQLFALVNGAVFPEDVRKKYLTSPNPDNRDVYFQSFLGYLLGLVYKFHNMSIEDPWLDPHNQYELSRYKQLSNHLYAITDMYTERLDGGYDRATTHLTYRDITVDVDHRSYDKINDHQVIIRTSDMYFNPLLELFSTAKQYTSVTPIYALCHGKDLSEYILKNSKDFKPISDLIVDTIHTVVGDACDVPSINEEVQRMFDTVGLKTPVICTELMSPMRCGNMIEMMCMFRSAN